MITRGSSNTKVVGNSGNTAEVDSNGQLHTAMYSTADTNNSTETLLLADATFTGVATNISAYNGISIVVKTDVVSATKGLCVEYSKDGLSGWCCLENYTVPIATGKPYSPPPFMGFYRVKYTNGSTDQTSFGICTRLHKNGFKWSSHNINDNLNDEDDAEIIHEKKPDKNMAKAGDNRLNIFAKKGAAAAAPAKDAALLDVDDGKSKMDLESVARQKRRAFIANDDEDSDGIEIAFQRRHKP